MESILCKLTFGAKQKKLTKKLYSLLESLSDDGIDKRFQILLNVVSNVAAADEYVLYIFDNKNEQYVLKAVLHNELENMNMYASSGNFLPYIKNHFSIPPILARDYFTCTDKLSKNIRENFINMVIGNEVGIILIGPSPHIKLRQRKMLDTLSKEYEIIIVQIVGMEDVC